jgi:hypothetical protein
MVGVTTHDICNIPMAWDRALTQGLSIERGHTLRDYIGLTIKSAQMHCVISQIELTVRTVNP